MLIVYALLTCLMLTAMLSDIRRYIIPNWLVLALMGFYPASVLLAPVKPDWGGACLVALGVFIFGVVLLMRFMGGGDIKLLTAASLYTGKAAFIDFIVYVAILGGLGTLLLLALRTVAPYFLMKVSGPGASVPRVLADKEPVPYGVAIAGAFLLLLWWGRLPGLVL